MTMMIERPTVAVSMTTADGESRPAEMWGQGSYTCGFCGTPVFSPADWDEHERANAEYYAARGESYTAEPYAYRARYFESGECANPMCVSALSGEHLARYREDERRRLERAETHARWQRAQDERKLAERLEREAADAKRARLADTRARTTATALQLSFGWHCFAGECETSGASREEYDAHMRAHGRKSPAAPKMIRLRKAAPKATLGKLDFDAAALVTWTQSHTEPATCKSCGHSARDHHERSVSYAGDVTSGGCEHCDCRGSIYGYEPGETTECERRGQFWSLGPDAHSAWFLPESAAPWETRRPEPVLLYHVAGGRWETSAYSARFARKYAA